MEFFLISDNDDTLLGMRLAGIHGILAHTCEDVAGAFAEIEVNKDIAVVLVTEKLVNLCEDFINGFKMTRRSPLVVGIPDRHITYNIENTISKYVRDSIGLKL